MARQRGERWQADVRRADGQRLRATFKTMGSAVAWEQAVRDADRDGRPIPEAGSGFAGKRDLSTLGSLFDHVSRTHWSDLRSAETLIRSGREVVDYFGRNVLAASISPADIDDFAAHLAAKGKARGTINRKLSALSTMFRIGHRNGALDSPPALPWKKELKSRFRYLDETEEAALLAYWFALGDKDQHDLCVFLIDTGARCFSEAVPLRWEDCTGKFATFWTTKSNRPRTVPLTKRCRAMLERRKRERPGTTGPFAGINKNTMRGRWDRMRETLGLEDVTPHTLRHTCCTRLVSGGADIKRVMEWMGHTTLATTMRYLQIRPRSLEDIVHLLEPNEDGDEE